MKYTIILLAILIVAACNPKSTTIVEETTTNDYTQLDNKVSLENWIGKKVVFIGKPCKMEYQHMLKTTIDGIPSYICIDSDITGQILGYNISYPIEIPSEKIFNFYGTIQKITGAGKGGGTHTEYYIDLDRID